MILSLDTETSGLDFFHGGVKPFLVTICRENNEQAFWEWDVDPLTRQPAIPREDLKEIAGYLEEAEEIAFQNAKFDIRALSVAGVKWKESWWPKVHDTLYSGHLLASGEDHDLTYQALKYLRVDITPFEAELHKAVTDCRKLIKKEFKDWKYAKEDDPFCIKMMPSNKGEKQWKTDYWTPRAYARAKNLPRGEFKVVNVKSGEPFDLMIDRSSKWGNPFVIGRDGDRQEVIAKYRKYILSKPELMNSLKELDGKVGACHCKPLDCHGDVLAELVGKLGHPWWTVCSKYANVDTGVTTPIWIEHKRLLKERKLWKVYLERRKLVKHIYDMETRGVTFNENRRQELLVKHTKEELQTEKICVGLSGGLMKELPKNGTSKALQEVVFKRFRLPEVVVKKKKKKTDTPSIDKNAIDHWLATLDSKTAAWVFLKNLKRNRGCNTAIGYSTSYNRFGIRCEGSDFYKLHPSFNATGSNTLRFSCSNPNGQNISKLSDANLRYMFGPRKGREWWSLDFSNLELTIPAYECNEEEMIQLFERPNDPPYFGSQHLLIAHILYPKEFEECLRKCESFKDKYKDTLYQWVKNGDFAVTYGAMEESGTADAAYHLPGAQRRIKERLSKLTKLGDYYTDFAKQHGFVWTLTDKEIGSGYPIQAGRDEWGNIRPTTCLNYHVQGSAMWAMCKAMDRVGEYLESLRIGAFMTLQVHDEIVIDVPIAKPGNSNLPIIMEVQRLMELSGSKDFGLPLRTSMSYHPQNWSKHSEYQPSTAV